MRESVKKSAADSPVKGFEHYPKGSIVICNACACPIYKLEAGITLGQKVGRTADLYKPLTLADLNALAAREDIDAGMRAMLSQWDAARRKQHVDALYDLRAGDPMACPICAKSFVQVLTVEGSETVDRAYTIELVTIPPAGKPAAIRGRQFHGPHGDWLH